MSQTNKAPIERKSAVVVFSGGQDSTTCLAWALNRHKEVHAVTFNYGQRHTIEIESAEKIIKIYKALYPHAKIVHEIINVPSVLKGTSPLVSNNDLEQYADSDSLPGGVEKTFVPCRNQLFLTIAANYSFVNNCDTLITGVCQADFGGYPDCRQEFITSLENTLNLGTFTGEDWLVGKLRILTPLMDLTKAESVNLAIDENAYYALGFSHTAYDGKFPPVGKDHASLLRAKGFEESGIPDPLVLRAWALGLMDLPQSTNYASPEVELALDNLHTYSDQVSFDQSLTWPTREED